MPVKLHSVVKSGIHTGRTSGAGSRNWVRTLSGVYLSCAPICKERRSAGARHNMAVRIQYKRENNAPANADYRPQKTRKVRPNRPHLPAFDDDRRVAISDTRCSSRHSRSRGRGLHRNVVAENPPALPEARHRIPAMLQTTSQRNPCVAAHHTEAGEARSRSNAAMSIGLQERRPLQRNQCRRGRSRGGFRQRQKSAADPAVLATAFHRCPATGGRSTHRNSHAAIEHRDDVRARAGTGR